MEENSRFILFDFWLINVLVVVALAFTCQMALKIFSKIFKTKFKNIDYIFFRPVCYLIWFLSFIYIFSFILKSVGFDYFIGYLVVIKNVGIVAFLSFMLFRGKNVLAKKEFKKIDKNTVEFINKIFSMIIFFVSLLVVLEIFGINVMPLIAFGGVGAAAIGFAAKDVISNFFGGLMIYITKPFKQGDLIEVPKEDMLGFVDHIGWYLTCLRNFDKCPVYVPNSIFSTAQIKNHSARSHRKLEYKIGVRYKDFEKLTILIDQIKSFLGKNEDIDSKENILVAFTDFKDYSLEIYIRAYAFYVSYEKFLSVKQDILMELQKIISSNGCEIPFPILTVDMEKN